MPFGGKKMSFNLHLWSTFALRIGATWCFLCPANNQELSGPPGFVQSFVVVGDQVICWFEVYVIKCKPYSKEAIKRCYINFYPYSHMCMLLHMVMLAINGPFGNIVIVMLFIFFENMCQWKNDSSSLVFLQFFSIIG